LVSKELVAFFQERYRHGMLQTNGLTPKQEESLRGKASTYLSRAKHQMMQDIEDLTTLASALPEKHLIEVFTQERIDKLVSALLTVHTVDLRPREVDGKFIDPERLIKESGKDLERLIKRQYQIAAMLMEKGADKCLEAFERKELESSPHRGMDSPLYRLVEREAGGAIQVLSYVATGVGGAQSKTSTRETRETPRPPE
jgi:hypothetical protein